MSDGQASGAVATGQGAAAAPINVSPSAGTVPATETSSSDWTSSFPEELRGYVQNKGFKDAGTVVDSYRNLEKLIGVPKEQLLKLPTKPDDAAWNDVYDRLGRPQKAEEYKFGEKSADPEFVKFMKENMHKLGVSRTQGEQLAAKWDEYWGSKDQTNLQNQNQRVQVEETALKKEWGAAFDHNVSVARNAAREFGMDEATIDKLESAMGFANVIKFMHNIGSKIGEDKFVSSGPNAFRGPLTPEAARNQISALKADTDFVRRYTTGDVNARTEMQKLHEYAYPE
jgi:hypothetical protein